MPSSLVAFYRAVFLRQAPRRYAVMQPQHADRKYNDYPGELSDQQISAHLAGRAAYAVPTVEHGLASLLPFDIDAGGEDAARALLAAASARGLWAFATVDPARGRGYVWIPFDDLMNADRLHALGAQILGEIHTRILGEIHEAPGEIHTQLLDEIHTRISSETREAPGEIHTWKIENRATAEDTRLPFARHTWSGRRGQLITQDGYTADLDGDDYTAQLAAFAASYRENPTDALPPPLETPQEARRSRQDTQSGPGVTIASYNARTDLADLLETYGARPARGRGARLHFCPFHGDAHASLLIARDGSTCHCLSRGSGCPLAERQHDAFNVFCIGEGLTTAQALRQLNGHPDDGAPPRTPPAAPGGARRTSGAPTPKAPPKTPREATSSAETTHAATYPPAYQFRACTASAEAPTTATEGRRLPKTCRRMLAFIHDQGGQYWRGVPQLARLLDCDPRTVQRSLRRLEAEGHLTRQARGRDGHTDIYQERGRQMPPTSEQNTTSTETLEADKGGQPDAPQPAEMCSQAEPMQAAPHQADADGAHHGPAGAIAYPGGAAYVPPEAAHWYTLLPGETPPEHPEEHPQETPTQAEIVSYDATEMPAAPARRRRRTTGATDPAQLTGRIIAAERKAATLERTGKARDKAQARAIRRNAQQLRGQLASIEEDRRTRYYTPDECDQWHAEHQATEHQATQGAASAPPYQLIGQEAPDARGLIARLRARQL